MTFTFYENENCTGDGTAIATAGSNDSSSGDPRSVDTSALGGGDYGFKATVASNANYDGATTDCEKFTITSNASTATPIVRDFDRTKVVLRSGSAHRPRPGRRLRQGGLITLGGNVSFTFDEEMYECRGHGQRRRHRGGRPSAVADTLR